MALGEGLRNNSIPILLIPFFNNRARGVKPRPNPTDRGYELRRQGPATLDLDALDNVQLQLCATYKFLTLEVIM
jgi:hypothetical protein